MKRTLILAANDSETAILANAADGSSPFAILQPDGFVVPYGNFPHKVGLQIFDRTAADAIVANHKGMLTKLVSWARGEKASYPVYVGHPDLPGSKDTDKRAYGWIENMRAEDDGLHLEVKWSDAGRELVENAHFKFYSPLWWTKPVKGGVRPVSLKSMGLTNDPNIPVPALANEAAVETSNIEPSTSNAEDQKQPIENDMTPELLAALGLQEGATPEEVLAAITALKQAAADKETAEEQAGTAADEKLAADQKCATAENELAAANEKITTMEAALKIAANHAVNDAVAAGKLTPAESEAKVTELLAANDFEVALQELGKMPAKIKTTSVTGDLGNAKTRLVVAANDEAKAQKEERATLVENEFQNTNPALSSGERRRIAWQRAQAKCPELFATMKKSSGSAA